MLTYQQGFAKGSITDNVRHYWRAGAIKGSDTIYSTVWYIDITNVGIKEKDNAGGMQLYALPNPFSNKTRIALYLPKEDDVKMTIYDAVGKEIQLLLNKHLPLGNQSVEWDGSGFSGGVYFYKIKTKDFSRTEKMVLIK